MKPVYFINPPARCDVCGHDFNKVMYDAITVQGFWACMCQECFDDIRPGILGAGLGQKYIWDDEAHAFKKVEG